MSETSILRPLVGVFPRSVGKVRAQNFALLQSCPERSDADVVVDRCVGMKRAAPSEEPVELSSSDDLSSDSDDEAGNGKGENSFRLPMSSKSTAPAKGESYFGRFLLPKESICALIRVDIMSPTPCYTKLV